jgi:hypothetical protein
MVWAKLTCEAAGGTWYILEMEELATDAIFLAYAVGWEEVLTYVNRSYLDLLSVQVEGPVECDTGFVPCRLSEVVTREEGRGRLFPTGQLVGAPGGLAAFAKNRQHPTTFLRRHVRGDWGELDAEDMEENEFSLARGLRLLSRYTLKDHTVIWIITEADRSVTTILLPDEY